VTAALSLVTADRRARVGSLPIDPVDLNGALEIIDRLSHDYTGAPFPRRSGVVFLVAAEREWMMELPFEDRPPAS